MVEIDGNAERALRAGDAGDVVEMGVRQQDVLNREHLTLRDLQQLVQFVAGIDQHGIARLLTTQDEAVLEEGGDRSSLDYHASVILAIVDDLMFTSKIKTTARLLGVPVV